MASFMTKTLYILMLPRKARLDHDLLCSPETDILKYHEYI